MVRMKMEISFVVELMATDSIWFTAKDVTLVLMWALRFAWTFYL